MEKTDNRIRCLADLPEVGLVLQSDFLSGDGERCLIPASRSSWRRMELTGLVPPPVFFFGKRANYAAHIKAIALGQDWRKVVIPDAAAASNRRPSTRKARAVKAVLA